MRHETYDSMLLACCRVDLRRSTVVAGLFETTTPAPAKTVAQAPLHVEYLAPMRAIGTPFMLNSDPSVRTKD